MLEGIIKDDVMSHLARNRLIRSSQHGFMPGRSCATNLLNFLEELTKAADSGSATDVVYLDFAKAFDKVPTERLLKKVESHGIGGQVKDWIQAWLRDRHQRVWVNGKRSGWRQVLSGVPQGSVLGPVLFLIYINDLDSVISEKQSVYKFADDTKVTQKIESRADQASLQACLDRLDRWAVDWGMAFNVSKCHIMHVGRNNPEYNYMMGGKTLVKTDLERDVGVLISSKLKPAEQCRKAAQTASAVLGQILQAFHYRDRHIYVSLYVQYVRPHLEFSAPAWSPWTKEDIDRLERVQERAVKAVSGLQGRTYEARLLELGLPTLVERRKEMDMVLTYKLVNSASDAPKWLEKTASRRPTRAASGKDNLVKPRSAHEYRKNFFSSRVTDRWNNLPDTVKSASSAESFKRLYRRYERTVAHVPMENET